MGIGVQKSTNWGCNPRGLNRHKMPPVTTSNSDSSDGGPGIQGPTRGEKHSRCARHPRSHLNLTVFRSVKHNVLPRSPTIIVERKIRFKHLRVTKSLAGKKDLHPTQLKLNEGKIT